METKSKNSKTIICAICHCNLNFTIQRIENVSICGHVFHQICLRKWMKRCLEQKAKSESTCPKCNQIFRASNVTRLFFDQNDNDDCDNDNDVTQDSEGTLDLVVPDKGIDWMTVFLVVKSAVKFMHRTVKITEISIELWKHYQDWRSNRRAHNDDGESNGN